MIMLQKFYVQRDVTHFLQVPVAEPVLHKVVSREREYCPTCSVLQPGMETMHNVTVLHIVYISECTVAHKS